MSPASFFVPLAIAVLLPFVLRYFRSAGAMDFVYIEREFMRYRKGRFVAARTTLLFSDMRVDRFAPGEFLELGAPYVAVFICRDKSGQHWLWKLYRPTERDPVLSRLTPEQAEEMLQRPGLLLEELCPEQQRRPGPPAPPDKKRRNFWEG